MVTDYRLPATPFAGTVTVPRPCYVPPLTGTSAPTSLFERLSRITSPVSSVGRADARQRFVELAKEWREATGHLSSPSQIAMHPAYQRIIGMGPSVVPFILEDLRQTGAQWYWALHAITGESPVPPGVRHTSRETRDIWLKWGRDHGYVDADRYALTTGVNPRVAVATSRYIP